jgi:predicted LPLAT superfamily acyltransferase
MEYKLCAVIATFNHYRALADIINVLHNYHVPVFIVDDGNNDFVQRKLNEIYHQYPTVKHQRLEYNQGKGAAVNAGLKMAAQDNYTHALQIDADGQHSLENLEIFIKTSLNNPNALISAHPIYDASIPLGRKIGRWFTHIWVWIETLSLRITDSMCGMRIYPLKSTLAILQNSNVGKRMDFDTEIMVKLFWAGTAVLMLPVKVTYPRDNISNFDVIKDNVRITKMHTKLVFKMLFNVKSILMNRPNYAKLVLDDLPVHWASLNERGTILGILSLVYCYRLLGRRICLIIGSIVMIYFYLTARSQRLASNKFMQKIYEYGGLDTKPNFLTSWQHFISFLRMMLDKIASWSNKAANTLEVGIISQITQLMSGNTGGILLISHLGNIDFCRALAGAQFKIKLHVLLHTKNSRQFTSVLQALNPNYSLNLIEVTEVGPQTIVWLQSRIALGEWIAIAADRIPVDNHQRTSPATFLGSVAYFSQGPYILASLLECPVYTAIAVPDGQTYRLDVELFAAKIHLERAQREQQLQALAQKYANFLEKYCLRYPFQWFNFFDFWKCST